MIVCDLCRKPIRNPIEQELPYEVTETTIRTKKFDLCMECNIELLRCVKTATCNFVNEKISKQEGEK